MIIKNDEIIVGQTSDKQKKLIAGDNIQITQDTETGNEVISASGGGGLIKWVPDGVNYDFLEQGSPTREWHYTANSGSISFSDNYFKLFNADDLAKIGASGFYNSQLEIFNTDEDFADFVDLPSSPQICFLNVENLLYQFTRDIHDEVRGINGTVTFTVYKNENLNGVFINLAISIIESSIDLNIYLNSLLMTLFSIE